MKDNIRQIARQRIQVLFQQAREIHGSNPKLSSRYIETARKIAMSARLRLPRDYRRQICKNCNTLLVHGQNCRVRINQRREPHVVTTCLKCGCQTRIVLRKKKEKLGIEQNNYQNETPR